MPIENKRLGVCDPHTYVRSSARFKSNVFSRRVRDDFKKRERKAKVVEVY